MKRLITIRKASMISKVPTKTLRIYADKGFIRCYRNPINKYRMFKKEELLEDLRKLRIINGE